MIEYLLLMYAVVGFAIFLQMAAEEWPRIRHVNNKHIAFWWPIVSGLFWLPLLSLVVVWTVLEAVFDTGN